MGRPKYKITNDILKKIIRLYNTGKSLREIGEKLGVSKQAVYSALWSVPESEVKIRQRGRPRKYVYAPTDKEVKK